MNALLMTDPSLGRLDYDSLPDQSLMGILIEGAAEEFKEAMKDSIGCYRDVCEWECITSDEETIRCFRWIMCLRHYFTFVSSTECDRGLLH